VVEELQQALARAEAVVEQTVAPARQSIIRRFPVLFLLAVTFGITATSVGIEVLLTQSTWLGTRPLLILGLGILTLVLTGTLYKKLG
jgi:hypothetical protein